MSVLRLKSPMVGLPFVTLGVYLVIANLRCALDDKGTSYIHHRVKIIVIIHISREQKRLDVCKLSPSKDFHGSARRHDWTSRERL